MNYHNRRKGYAAKHMLTPSSCFCLIAIVQDFHLGELTLHDIKISFSTVTLLEITKSTLSLFSKALNRMFLMLSKARSHVFYTHQWTRILRNPTFSLTPNLLGK